MKHPKTLKYSGGLEQLAEDIVNLRYDALGEFLGILERKFQESCDKDKDRGRVKLALELSHASYCMKMAKVAVDDAWKISRSYMNEAETHAPMNDTCEKCGRIYCDHENKY